MLRGEVWKIVFDVLLHVYRGKFLIFVIQIFWQILRYPLLVSNITNPRSSQVLELKVANMSIGYDLCCKMDCVVDFLLYAKKVIYHWKKFDPRFFLARIHENTYVNDLEVVNDALKLDLQNYKDYLKKLLIENFDRFIFFKNTIDGNNSIIT